MTPKNIAATIFAVVAVSFYCSCSRFYGLLRKERGIEMQPEEPMAWHWLSDFRALKFLLTRQYRTMGQKIRLWGDISLALTLLGWLCILIFFYLANSEHPAPK